MRKRMIDIFIMVVLIICFLVINSNITYAYSGRMPDFVTLDYLNTDYSIIPGMEDCIIINGFKDGLRGSAYVEIPEKIDGKKVLKIKDNAFENDRYILTLELPSTLTEIGESAFEGCTNLGGTVTIPGSVKIIKKSAFDGCNISELIIQDGVTEIQEKAFYSNALSQGVDFPDSIEKIGQKAFANNYHLTSVDLPSSIENIESGAFYQCIKLNNVRIGSGLVEIKEETFANCWALESIEFSETVTTIGQKAFCSCKNLEKIYIPKNITSIEDYAFMNCEKLKKIEGFKGVTSVNEGVFYNCSCIDSLAFMENVTDIHKYAFYGCSGLQNLLLPEKVTSIETGAFTYCNNLVKVVIPDSVLNMGKDVFSFSKNTCLRAFYISKSVVNFNDVFTCINHRVDVFSGASQNDVIWESACENIISGGDRSYENIIIHYDKTSIDCDVFLENYNNKCIFGNHSFTNYCYDNNASCFDGTETAYCDYGCGETHTRTVYGTALGHDFSNHRGLNKCSRCDEQCLVLCINDSFNLGMDYFNVGTRINNAYAENENVSIAVSALAWAGGTYYTTKVDVYAKNIGTTNIHFYKGNTYDSTLMVKVIDHNISVLEAVPATTTSAGKTEGEYCSICKKYIKRQEIIPALNDDTTINNESNNNQNNDDNNNDYGKQNETDNNKNAKKYSNEWVNGKWYNADGTQTYTGTLTWKSNSTGWWVEDSAGWYPQSQWQKIDGVWYYFKPDGYMASNEYYNGYWFNSNGSWDDKYELSWKSNSTGWWVEDKSGWWPSSKWLKIDGSWYYFNASGYMVTNQYVDGYWLGSDGACW